MKRRDVEKYFIAFLQKTFKEFDTTNKIVIDNVIINVEIKKKASADIKKKKKKINKNENEI